MNEFTRLPSLCVLCFAEVAALVVPEKGGGERGPRGVVCVGFRRKQLLRPYGNQSYEILQGTNLFPHVSMNSFRWTPVTFHLEQTYAPSLLGSARHSIITQSYLLARGNDAYKKPTH